MSADQMPWPIRARLKDVITDFELAKTSAKARRFEAVSALKETLQLARDVGDYGGLPCSLKFWNAALGAIEAWAEGSPDAQDGALRGAASAMADALLRMWNETAKAEEAEHIGAAIATAGG